MTPAQLLVDRLSAYLGKAAAQSAVNTFCKQTVGVAPDNLTKAQLALVLPSLKPMLALLLGAARADALLQELTRELTQ